MDPTPPRTRVGRRLRRGLWLLLGLYALYLAVANTVLGSDLGRAWVSRKPETFQAEWSSGRTLLPGRVVLRDLKLRGQSRRVRWALELDEVRFRQRLWALPGKWFSAGDITGSGLAFRMRVRPEAGGEVGDAPAGDPAGRPEIGGFSGPLAAPPAETDPRPTRRPWRVSLDDVSIDEVREVWVDEQRLEGSGRLTGDVDFRVRGELRMERSVLVFDGASVHVADELVARDVALRCDVHFEPFVTRLHRGKAALPFLSGGVRFQSSAARFGFLNRYLAGAPWLEVDGSARVLADLPVVEGVLAPGAHVEIDGPDVIVRVLEFEAQGEGSIRGEIVESGRDDASRLTALFTSFQVRRQVTAASIVPGTDHAPLNATLVEGEDLRLSARGGPIELGREPPDMRVEVALGPSRVPDLRAYNIFLPPAGGLTLRSGSGSLRGELSLATATDSGSGTLAMEASGVGLTFGDRESTGDLSVSLALQDAQLSRRLFDFATSRIELKRFFVAGQAPAGAADAGWWGRVRLERAQIRADAEPELDAKLHAEMRDSRPVAAIIGEKKPLLGWLERLLIVEDVVADAQVRLDRTTWSVDDLRIVGTRLEILADDLRLTDQRRSGALYLSRGPLAAGVELKDGERDWKFVRPRAWYDRVAAQPGSP